MAERDGEEWGFLRHIEVAPDSWAGSPAFYIHLFNNSINYIYGYVRPPFESAEMKLFDSNGNQVAKTAMGKTVGGWTDKKIEDWFDEFVRQQKKRLTDHMA